jgi:hypothetical protein
MNIAVYTAGLRGRSFAGLPEKRCNRRYINSALKSCQQVFSCFRRIFLFPGFVAFWKNAGKISCRLSQAA